jgi:hypothetical protein
MRNLRSFSIAMIALSLVACQKLSHNQISIRQECERKFKVGDGYAECVQSGEAYVYYKTKGDPKLTGVDIAKRVLNEPN